MALQQPFSPGEILLHTLFRNRYFIVRKVGAGGFGSVYKAMDTQSGDRLVALKEVSLLGLHPQAMIEATTAFQREVSVLSQLDHPHLPRVYEHFQTPGHCYLVMDFIAGETLEQYQSQAPNRRLLLSEVLEIGIPRYFKPGQPKDTVALGSLGYAAPEQYGKAQTTPRADIYSLGAVLHQFLTARDPSEAPFRFLPLRPTSQSDPGSLTTSMVDVLVNKLETLIARMLAMDVNKRPPDAACVQQELHEMSVLWSDIRKSFWRPKLGYTQQTRN